MHVDVSQLPSSIGGLLYYCTLLPSSWNQSGARNRLSEESFRSLKVGPDMERIVRALLQEVREPRCLVVPVPALP